MSLLNFLLGCVIHIILILIFEGVFLFVILFPIVNKVAYKLTLKFNKIIFSIVSNMGYSQYINVNFTNIEDAILLGKYPANFIIEIDLNDTLYTTYHLQGNVIYSFKDPINNLVKGCSITETIYLQINQYMPYIIYSVLLFVLIVICIILICIAKIYNIKINVLYLIINSFIIFLLIASYAFLVIWYILTQPYALKINRKGLLALQEFANE